MTNPTKWADVAHMYAKSEILVSRNYTAEFLESWVGKKTKAHNDHRVEFGYEYWGAWRKGSQFHIESMTPVLRHVEDMTEGERKELWRFVFGNWRGSRFSELTLDFRGRTQVFKSTGCMTADRLVMMQGVERLGIEANGTVWADCDLHNFGFDMHKTTLWLLSKGFDLFGLIESGQAIRKEATNGH